MKHGKISIVYLTLLLMFIMGSGILPMPKTHAAKTATLPKIVQVSAGVGHALAVGVDGTLWAWGDNSTGELGDGTYITRTTPVQVGGENSWVSAAAGDKFSVAIKKDGSLWMWGTNMKNVYINWQPAIHNLNLPARFGKDNDWVKISSGGAGTAAIRKDGSIWQFGLNVLPGNIGNGLLNHDKDWKDVSVGDSSLLALKKDGSLWAMGHVVPSGKVTERLLHIGNGEFFDQIAASNYSVARKKDGSVWALKDDLSNNSVKLEQVMDISTAARITGEFTSGILDSEGVYRKWDTMFDDYEKIECPVKLIEVDDGGSFGVALDEKGTPWTYGMNDWGQRGNGVSKSLYAPVPREDTNILDEVTTDFDTFTLQGNGTLEVVHHLFGNNTKESLGRDTDWASIAGNRDELYALKKDGSLWSYRAGDRNPSGLSASTAPVMDSFQAGSYWNSIKVSDQGYAIGLKKNGTLWFWGRDSWKMILKDSISDDFIPPFQLSADTDWQSFSVYNSSILAIKKNGTLWALGDNRQGKLGITASSTKLTNFTKVGSYSDWVQAKVGDTTTVGVRKDGSLWQMNTTSLTTISQTKDWVNVWNSGTGIFALKKDGSLWAWGDNSYGQLGIGAAEYSTSPTRVTEQGPWTTVYTSPYYTVGVKADHSVWHWGNDMLEYNKPQRISDLEFTSVLKNVEINKPTLTIVITVNTTYAKSTVVVGRTDPNMMVKIKRSTGVYQGKSDSKGVYKVKVPPLVAGETLSIWTEDESGNRTGILSTVVQKNKSK